MESKLSAAVFVQPVYVGSGGEGGSAKTYADPLLDRASPSSKQINLQLLGTALRENHYVAYLHRRITSTMR
jgi:hypothetical protein